MSRSTPVHFSDGDLVLDYQRRVWVYCAEGDVWRIRLENGDCVPLSERSYGRLLDNGPLTSPSTVDMITARVRHAIDTLRRGVDSKQSLLLELERVVQELEVLGK